MNDAMKYALSKTKKYIRIPLGRYQALLNIEKKYKDIKNNHENQF